MTGAGALQDSQAIADLVKEEQADIVCLQETKLKDSDVEACEMILKPTLPDYHFYWNNSIARKGYSGTAIISRCAGINQACLQLQAWHLARLAIQASCISITTHQSKHMPSSRFIVASDFKFLLCNSEEASVQGRALVSEHGARHRGA